MKKLLLFLLLALPAIAQNSRIDGIAIGPRGPVPFATVAVCTQPANTATTPCSPLANLCSSLTDGICNSPNPVTADLLGNFFFYGKQSQGPVTVQIYGTQIATPYVMTNQSLNVSANTNNTWTGTNIFNGPVVFNGGLTANAFISSSANPAVTGNIRFATADTFCWRNNANTGDVCLSKSITDQLVWPNGLSLGGGTVLANTNQSGTGTLCMTTNCQLTTPALNGVTISGTPSAGQVLQATSPTAASWGSGAPSFNAPFRSTTLANTAISANTQTIVITESVTFPSAAGTYRALVSYGIWATIGANLCMAEAIDTTNSRAFALTGQNANGSGFIGLAATELSPQTYAASAVATFTVQVNCNAASTITTGAGTNALTPGENTYLSVTPVLSN